MVNMSRIWILHLGIFSSYVAYALSRLVSKDIATLFVVEANPNPEMLITPSGDTIGTSSSIFAQIPLNFDSVATSSLRYVFDFFLSPSSEYLYYIKHSLALTGIGGAVCILFSLLCTLLEGLFLPASTIKYRIILRRLAILLLMLIPNVKCKFFPFPF